MATKIELEELVDQLEGLIDGTVDILTDPDLSDEEKVDAAAEYLGVDQEDDD